MIIRKTVGDEQSGVRLDDAIALLCSGVSKSEARRIIDRGGCTVNVSLVRVASRCVKAGDVTEIGVIKGTVEFWVTEYFRSQGSAEPARVVHRLDRGTSGAMLFPKHKKAAAWISSCFQNGQVDKRYLALVSGTPEQERWAVDAPIGKVASARYGIVPGGKSSVTEFRIISSTENSSLVEARPLTGRTHQIRVHLAESGLPIIGDATYGNVPAERMLLHCSVMTFRNPAGKEIQVMAPLDDAFMKAGVIPIPDQSPLFVGLSSAPQHTDCMPPSPQSSPP